MVVDEGKAKKTKLDQATADTVVSIIRNEGLYLTRTYDAFDADADWKHRMPESVRNNMFAMLTQEEDSRVQLGELRNQKRLREGNPEKSVKPAMTPKQIRTRMNEILDQALESGDLQALNNTKIGQQGRNILKRRKNIAKVYREFLGEVRDPELNYLRTVDKMNNMIEQFKLAQRVRDIGLGDFLFEKDDPNRPEDATVLIAAPDSKTQEPLAGLYATPDMKAMFNDTQAIYDKAPKWLQKYYNLESAFQRAKTSWSPQSHMRQIVGNPIMLMANGNFKAAFLTPGTALRHVPGFKQAFDKMGIRDLKTVGTKGAGTQEQRSYFNRATELGLVGQGVEYRLFKDWSSKRSRADDIAGELFGVRGGKIARGMSLSKLNEKFGQQYAWEDSMFKIASWEAEKAKYAKTGEYDMNDPADVARLEEDAAQIVRQTNPSYDELPDLVEHVRAIPGVGMFMAFPTSQVINAGNRAALTVKELRNPNPKVKMIGVKRAMAQLATYSAPLILAKAIQAMLGIEDEEMEALRSVLPEWARDATLIPLGRDKDGNIQYINMSYVDPHAYFIEPIMLALKGRDDESIAQSIGRAMLKVVEPYAQETMGATAMMDVMRNTTSYGSDVYDPDGGVAWAAMDIGDHVSRNTLMPGGLISAERIWKGYTGEQSKGGKVYNLPYELMSVGTGFKLETFNPKQSLDFDVNNYKNRLKSSNNHLYRLDAEGHIPMWKKGKAIQQSDATHAKGVQQMHQEFEAYRRLDPTIDKAHLTSLMKARRLTDEDINQAYTGVVEPRIPPTLRVMDRMLDALPEGERRDQVETARDEKLTETIYKMGDPETDRNRIDIQRAQKDIARYGLAGQEGLTRMVKHLKMEKIEREFKKYTEVTGGRFEPVQVRKLATIKVFNEPFQWNKKRIYRALRIGLEMGMTSQDVMEYIGQEKIR